ncbi:transcriptional regulator with PAS, ATPase and Fis domain [Sedimentibacter acidaminivorans]|uniref:Transcriptional regulator with PAS, ATPase and Fis domain n=1 Tax=Sedimentibacter acidaminivorans TaxID=913099 RepID=A0ABS4GB63_9FIRM|nr:sigma 54-interacting transcriptional regulator [Sedimentibacter acidaminivorans]MBP1924928.1 transcriptional regulator with PAS, ATPase and Fis domain [Sedimentibacter acidaminivorans]
MNDNYSNMSLEEIKKMWHKLHENPELRNMLRPEILHSWDRSFKNQVSAYSKKTFHLYSKEEYSYALQKSKDLIDCAFPVMENLVQFMQDTGFVVCLTDPNLVILKVLGDKKSMEWAQKSNLIERSVWNEDLVGTNTGTLAIELSKPISLYGYEHYCLSNVVSTASGCPIFENDKIIGVIGMVAPYDKIKNQHTLGMVSVAAKQIQSAILLKRIYQYQQVILNSMSDGVIAINDVGNITFINKKCKHLLSLNHDNLVGSNLLSVLGNSNDNLYFIETVTKEITITDEFFVISSGKTKIKCNITSTPIKSSNNLEKGNVLIIREYERSNHLVKKWIGRSNKMTFHNIITSNDSFKKIIEKAKIASYSSSNILLLGESGTGKDVLAQAIHNESHRKNNPFVAINCAALPRELLSSELFGYEDGAFTGAKKGGNIGKIELADQGTLFLDEIGDIPLDLQVTLLRVIEEKSIVRLGGNKLIPVNIRIIAATNKDLEVEISKNKFRLDLYYRLGVIKLKIPPLRERPEDILILTDYFLKNICSRFNKPLKNLSKEAKEVFLNYQWPGNVRELQNVLESSIQLSPCNEITYTDIKGYININNQHLSTTNDTYLHKIPEIEKKMIERYLNEKFTKDEIAKILGISRRTLYRRLEKYKLK